MPDLSDEPEEQKRMTLLPVWNQGVSGLVNERVNLAHMRTSYILSI